jgi:hypothetical protein
MRTRAISRVLRIVVSVACVGLLAIDAHAEDAYAESEAYPEEGAYADEADVYAEEEGVPGMAEAAQEEAEAAQEEAEAAPREAEAGYAEEESQYVQEEDYPEPATSTDMDAGGELEAGSDASPPDLDAYDEERLNAELEDELDDIYQDHQVDPYGEYDIDALRAWFLECLMSDSDNNPEVTYANLQAEMAEAGTTLEDAIDEGLAEADLLSSTNMRLQRLDHAVALGLTSSGDSTLGMESRANRLARGNVSVGSVKFSISRGVRRR